MPGFARLFDALLSKLRMEGKQEDARMTEKEREEERNATRMICNCSPSLSYRPFFSFFLS